MRLWAVLRGVERLWEALGGFIDFGWLCHALGGFGFGRLWEAFEKPWGALGGCGLSIVCPSPRLWEALGSFGSLWEVLGGFERFWKALESFGTHGKGWLAAWLWSNGGFGRFWRLFFERYGRLLEDFRKL